MNRLRALSALAVLAAIGLAGCAPTTRFAWGSYDSTLYAYTKHPERQPELEESLKAAIAQGRSRGQLAPGLQAELGYCYLGRGERAAAIEQFRAEMADFPESRAFLTRIIQQIGG